MNFIRWMLHSMFTGEPQRLFKEAQALEKRGEHAAAVAACDKWLRLYG